MSERSDTAEELKTARLWLRRPEEADIDVILDVHSDPGTCVHNLSDALTRHEEAEQLYRAGTSSGNSTVSATTGSSGATAAPGSSASAGSSPWNCMGNGC
jgi:hypothetical protein